MHLNLHYKNFFFSFYKTKINENSDKSYKNSINDLLIETGEELTESMQCTTAGSLESLNSVPVNFILN